MMRYLRIFGILPFFIYHPPLHAQQTINVAPDGVNDVLVIKNAIEQAKTFIGRRSYYKIGGRYISFTPKIRRLRSNILFPIQ